MIFLPYSQWSQWSGGCTILSFKFWIFWFHFCCTKNYPLRCYMIHNIFFWKCKLKMTITPNLIWALLGVEFDDLQNIYTCYDCKAFKMILSIMPWGPFREQFFHPNSYIMENCFCVTPLWGIISLQTFAHATTAQQNKISIEIEFWRKNSFGHW